MSPESILRWTARTWGIASTLLLLAFAFLFFPVGVVAGFAVAWRRELAGGLITVGSLTLFYLYLFAWGSRQPPGPYFLIFAAPGFLHLANALLVARKLK